MKTRCISGLAAALALSAGVTLFAQKPLTPTPPGQETPQMLTLKPKAENVPDIPVKVVPDFMKLPPNAAYLMGEGIGVSRNSKGLIYVNTCSQQTRVLEFDRNGNYVREIGKDLFGHIWCHGVRVDAQDNIWSIDSGANMIIKFNPAGRVTMVVGRRPDTRERARAHRGGGRSGSALHHEPPDGRRIRRPRQHLRVRRLRQCARHQVRQERHASSNRPGSADRGPAS